MKISESVILNVLQTAYTAGSAIMEVYNSAFTFEFKADNSPLTLADKKSHVIISNRLLQYRLPILSEEGSDIEYHIRKHWAQYWLIDPLDGTKEFIKKNGEFTVNIALINEGKPMFGVVYAPVDGFIYWGSANGAFRLNTNILKQSEYLNYKIIHNKAEELPCIQRNEGYIVLGSRSHINVETEAFIEELRKSHADLSFVSRGSSLKFCTLAEGGADIYPRFGATMEWDTAAGHAVAAFAGCSVNQYEQELPLTYNKPSLLNPCFIAQGKKK